MRSLHRPVLQPFFLLHSSAEPEAGRIDMEDIEHRLREMAVKWRDANREVSDVCRDAAEEIRVLRVQCQTATDAKDSIITAYQHGSGWGKGKDE